MSELSLKPINHVEIKKIPLPPLESDKVLGSDLFEKLYANVLILAKKNSGKTTVVYNIIRECADKDTTVIVFSATHEKDTSWIAIKEYMEKHNIESTFYTDLIEDGVNMLETYINELKKADAPEEEQEPKKSIYECSYDGDDEKQVLKVRKPRKKKYLSPKIIFIFDDMAGELRSPWLSNLAKKHRHFKTKVITSTQYIHDVPPDMIKQQDYILLFPGIDDEKLEILYKHIVIGATFEELKKIYKYASSEKFNFLYIDINKEQFRKKFNQLILNGNSK